MADPTTARRSLSPIVLLGSASAIVALVVVSVASYRSVVRLEEDVRARAKIRTSVLHLLEVRTHLMDAESGQRGYLITGDARYLERYTVALGRISEDTMTLRALAADEPLVGPLLARVSPLIADKLTEMATTVRLWRDGRADAARAIVRSDRGNESMDHIREELRAGRAALEDLRDRRSARVEAGTRRAKAIVLAGSCLGVTLLGLAAAVIVRQERGRRLAELALRESESRLYQILEVMPVGVFVADADGHPFYANRKSQDLLGQGVMPDAPPEKLTEVYHTYVAGTDRIYPVAQTPLARALAGEPAHADDLEVRRPGGPVLLEVWGAPVFGDDGKVKFGIAAFGDITDRERLRREREALHATLGRNVVELESLNRELESFSYSVSHDLRAPLRAIDGFSRILLEDHAGGLSPEGTRLLDVVRERAQRMGRLIDDLLRFSQLSRQEMTLAEIDMTALVGGIVRDLQADGTHNGAEVVATPLPGARGDAGMLRQVWINFISNALKYSSRAPHPRVEIGGREEGTERVYWVRDNGVGFEMAYVGRLFGVFQRLHRIEDFEGTGVGLAIVQRVVLRHGGRVWAEGKPDAGATFYFSLPARG